MSQRLHKHSLPIILLATGVFLVSMAGTLYLLPPASRNFNQMLGEHFLSVKFSTRGIVQITRYQTAEVNQYTNSGLGLTENAGTQAITSLTDN